MAAQYLNPQRAFIWFCASLQSLRNRDDKWVFFQLPFNFLFYYLNIRIFIYISEYPYVFSAQVSVPSRHMWSFLAALTAVSPVQNPPFIRWEILWASQDAFPIFFLLLSTHMISSPFSSWLPMWAIPPYPSLKNFSSLSKRRDFGVEQKTF